ncbi:hypothetical protein TNCV_408141 [Trichonephila clavipes]|nr:hypothetical protein TNCV_408141 [Trichonephila clavipes]
MGEQKRCLYSYWYGAAKEAVEVAVSVKPLANRVSGFPFWVSFYRSNTSRPFKSQVFQTRFCLDVDGITVGPCHPLRGGLRSWRLAWELPRLPLCGLDKGSSKVDLP